jgi:glucokinase
MTNYTWTVSAGGTITAGGGTGNNTVTVTWNTDGAQTVSVNYTNTNSCTASVATIYNVTVNPLPLVTLSGPTTTCVNASGNVYTTEAGMGFYNWIWPLTSIITVGGMYNNTIAVTFYTPGNQTIGVNYGNGNNCWSDVPPSVNVTVNPLPVVTLSGPASACVNSIGNVYTTESGMTNYTWTVSAGGTVTAGGGTSNNTATIKWNIAGPGMVSVNYSDINSCKASAAKVYNVTVNPLPVPTISGPNSVCQNSTEVYTTETGMTNYIWTVSAGGNITAGGGTGNNTVTVKWNTAGAQTVSVNYSDGNACTVASATIYNVTVNPLPIVTLSGPATSCLNSTGNVYTTEGGMTNYTWTVSSGGTITSGGGTGNNTVTVKWNTPGTRSVSVNYINTGGCTATAATVYYVTVNPVAMVTIMGPDSPCMNSTGNVYTTEAGMTNYTWAVSAGGTIAAGGGTTNNTATVTWNTEGPQTVAINYTNGLGCTAPFENLFDVTVNPLALVTLSGSNTACVNSIGNIYTTEAGMTNYTWVVSAGGSITAGGGTTNNTVTVKWNTAGAQTVSVNYTNGNGCTAAEAKIDNVTVNPLPEVTLSGPIAACVNSSGNVYTSETGMTNYEWNMSAGGTITAGGITNDNTVTITWNTAGAQTVSVNYINGNNCTASTPALNNILVNPLPATSPMHHQ